MKTLPALLAVCAGNSPVTGEFPAQRPVTWSFDVFCDLCQNKRLSKQSWGWWFETPSRPLWRHSNVPTPDLLCITLTISYLLMARSSTTVILNSSSWVYSIVTQENKKHQCIYLPHYGDVNWPSWRLESPVNRVFIPTYVQINSKGTSKVCVTGPLLGESTDGR